MGRLIQRALAGSAKSQAVVGVAPAGAGKSYAVGTSVIEARKRNLRVYVGTPTNEQAYALVFHLAQRLPGETIAWVPSSKASLPAHSFPNIVTRKAKHANGDAICVATLDKLGDAFARGDLAPANLLLLDEAYQANSVHYYKVAGLAPSHLLLGDSGQLAPFSTAPEGDRWRGLDEDPLLRAVEVLDRMHPGTFKEFLPITRRLDPRAVPVVRAFYPGHAFGAAVLPGIRRLDLAPSGSVPDDAILDHAATAGWAHVELPATAVLLADAETVSLLVRLTQRLLARNARVKCENNPAGRPLEPRDIAVCVSHNDQKDQLRMALDACGWAPSPLAQRTSCRGSRSRWSWPGTRSQGCMSPTPSTWTRGGCA